MIDAAMADSMEAKLEQADELAESSPAAAAAQYESLIVSPETGEEATKVKEQAIYRALGGKVSQNLIKPPHALRARFPLPHTVARVLRPWPRAPWRRAA